MLRHIEHLLRTIYHRKGVTGINTGTKVSWQREVLPPYTVASSPIHSLPRGWTNTWTLRTGCRHKTKWTQTAEGELPQTSSRQSVSSEDSELLCRQFPLPQTYLFYRLCRVHSSFSLDTASSTQPSWHLRVGRTPSPTSPQEVLPPALFQSQPFSLCTAPDCLLSRLEAPKWAGIIKVLLYFHYFFYFNVVCWGITHSVMYTNCKCTAQWIFICVHSRGTRIKTWSVRKTRRTSTLTAATAMSPFPEEWAFVSGFLFIITSERFSHTAACPSGSSFLLLCNILLNKYTKFISPLYHWWTCWPGYRASGTLGLYLWECKLLQPLKKIVLPIAVRIVMCWALWCARHCIRRFIYILSLNPHNDPGKLIVATHDIG